MEGKYKEFLGYSFGENEAFRRYIDAIEPPPPLSKIIYYKKKFYRQAVDHEFDINYDPDKPATQNVPPQEEKKTEQEEKKGSEEQKASEEKKGEDKTIPEDKKDSSPSEKKTLPWLTKFQLMLFFVFLCMFPLGLVARSYYHGVPVLLAFLIGVIKKYGLPKFNKMYWQGLFMDDHFHNLVGTIVCITSASSTVIVWFPIILRAVVFCAECIMLMSRNGNKLAQIAHKCTGKIAEKREFLMTFKADLEVYAGFYLIGALLMGWVSLVLPLFYWQMMQIKYMISGYTRIALDKLAEQMDTIISNPSCPAPLRWILQGLRKLGSYMAKMTQPEPQPPAGQQPQQQQGSSWCTVF